MTERTTELQRLRADLEKAWEAIRSLSEGVSCFKPIPVQKPQHKALRDILGAAPVDEVRPYTLPEHRQVDGGAVA